MFSGQQYGHSSGYSNPQVINVIDGSNSYGNATQVSPLQTYNDTPHYPQHQTGRYFSPYLNQSPQQNIPPLRQFPLVGFPQTSPSIQPADPYITRNDCLHTYNHTPTPPSQDFKYALGGLKEELSPNALKEQIRVNILQQLTPRHKDSHPLGHQFNTRPVNLQTPPSSQVLLQNSNYFPLETRKRPKRPASNDQEVGGKKQRFGDARPSRKSPNNNSNKNHTNNRSQQSSSGSPPAGRGSYHDGGANYIPGHQIVRALSAKDPCDKISRAIVNYFIENQQTTAVYDRKLKLREALFSVVQGLFPYSGLYIVGSSLSGFGTKKSDMDMCLMISQQGIDQKKEATDLLYALYRSLKECSFVKNLEVIRAKVPILRFRDKISNVECDLNVNNLVGIRNTHLLKHYALMDWRVRPLGLFIKYWARAQNINDARNMTISSYSFALMLIHYLQCGCIPPVLPTLQIKYPREFNSTSDVRTLKPVTFPHQSTNNLSVGELFLGFLEYYSFTYDYRQDAISVRQGRTIPIRELQKRSGVQGKQWGCLCIEEPFDLTNTARSVYNMETFLHIQKVFRGSYIKLNKGKDVKEIITKKI